MCFEKNWTSLPINVNDLLGLKNLKSLSSNSHKDFQNKHFCVIYEGKVIKVRYNKKVTGKNKVYYKKKFTIWVHLGLKGIYSVSSDSIFKNSQGLKIQVGERLPFILFIPERLNGDVKSIIIPFTLFNIKRFPYLTNLRFQDLYPLRFKDTTTSYLKWFDRLNNFKFKNKKLTSYSYYFFLLYNYRLKNRIKVTKFYNLNVINRRSDIKEWTKILLSFKRFRKYKRSKKFFTKAMKVNTHYFSFVNLDCFAYINTLNLVSSAFYNLVVIKSFLNRNFKRVSLYLNMYKRFSFLKLQPRHKLILYYKKKKKKKISFIKRII